MSVYTTMMPDWQYLYLQANTHNIWGMHILLMRAEGFAGMLCTFPPYLTDSLHFNANSSEKAEEKERDATFLQLKLLLQLCRRK